MTKDDKKTALKLILLNLCDSLDNEQIEEVIACAEDLLDVPHNHKRV